MVWSSFLSLLLISITVSAEQLWNQSQIDIDLGVVYDWQFGELALWHSESTYCDPPNYLTRTYKGILAGFVPVYRIYEKSHGTEGYIGYTTSQNTIYVAFRGSAELQNWLDNIDVILTNYPLCSGCEVHRGFYSAQQDSINEIITQVLNLKTRFPSYQVILTGHSLGGALATLTAMDLLQAGVIVRLFTFGSPRVGNDQFVAYASQKIASRYRVTHNRDMVVHIPLHQRFTHLSGEYYQPTDAVYLETCTGYEDPNCSYQWHVNNIKDHLYYLGVVFGSDGCSAVL